MKRVLCITGSMDNGGAESFFMKVFREIDKSRFKIDFCVSAIGKAFYDDEILANNSIIHYIPMKSNNFFGFCNSLYNLVRNGEYEIVIRMSDNSLSIVDLLIAKMAGAKQTVFRSTNTRASGGWSGRFVHRVFKPLVSHYSDIKIAPSTEAAVHMFGKNYHKKERVNIIHNGLKTDSFVFSLDVRKKTRSSQQLDQKFVIGHIGRMQPQKNHFMILSIFKEIVALKPNAILVLVGDGELREDIQSRAEDLGISDSVVMLGVRADIPDLLMAMDVFLLPSLYEGLPNVVIEAQASGLPCVVSDTVTKEVDVTGLVHFVSLSNPPKKWAEIIIATESIIRENTKERFIEKGYDIQDVAKRFSDVAFDTIETKKK